MIRVHLTISGDVQGVFFRAHTQEKAEEFDVKGWVANEADGTVSVVIEGPENKVNDLVDWCHGGPSTSTVEKVQIEQSPYTEEFEDFHIRY